MLLHVMPPAPMHSTLAFSFCGCTKQRDRRCQVRIQRRMRLSGREVWAVPAACISWLWPMRACAQSYQRSCMYCIAPDSCSARCIDVRHRCHASRNRRTAVQIRRFCTGELRVNRVWHLKLNFWHAAAVAAYSPCTADRRTLLQRAIPTVAALYRPLYDLMLMHLGDGSCCSMRGAFRGRSVFKFA